MKELSSHTRSQWELQPKQPTAYILTLLSPPHLSPLLSNIVLSISNWNEYMVSHLLATQ